MTALKFLSSCLAALAMSGCITINYEGTAKGTLVGSLFVMWVGEDKFVYAPDLADPLTFTRANNKKIKPGIMYTDGGSIPKIAQPINGLSPWGYAPAYMIHDWMFAGRHCIVDGMNDGRFDDILDVTFDESALILAEVIKTLTETNQVPRNEFAFDTISNAVDTFVAQTLWDTRGACETIKSEHLAAVRAAMGGSARQSKSLFSAPFQLETRPSVRQERKAVKVARFSFGPGRQR